MAVPSIAAAELQVDPESIDFGDVRIDAQPEIETIDLTNTDTEESIEVTASLADDPDCDAFALPGATSFTIEPGTSAFLDVEFLPPERGAFGPCVVELDEGDPPAQTINVELFGDGVAPIISIAPDQDIEFPDTRVGETSDDQTLIVANGDDEFSDVLTVSVAIDGGDEESFEAEIDGCDEIACEIEPGDEVTVRVRFAPRSRGDLVSTLVIAHDDPDLDDIALGLFGTGTEAELVADPTPIEFPITRVGETSTVSVDLVNEGNLDLEIEALTPSDSVIEVIDGPSTPFPIPAGESRTITLEFEPVESADVDATLTAQAPELEQAAEFPIVAPIADAELSEANIDFGDVRVDRDPVTRELILTNTGTATFEVVSVAVDDTENFAVDFAPGSAAGPLPPTESVAFEIVADLENVGTQSATVTIGTDIPDAQFLDVQVSATGISPDLVVSDGAIRFGAHDVLADPALRSVTVGNHAGATAPLELDSVQIVGLGSTVYDIVDDGGIPTPLGPGESVDVTVAYDPVVASPGEPHAALFITSDLRDAELPISGRGIDRAIQLSPESVIFPETYRYPESPPTRTIEVRNHGAAPLALTAAVVGGAAPDAFRVDLEALPEVIMGGESAALEIEFAPTVASASPLEARLVIDSDDRDRPSVEVGLSGRSVLPNLAMTPGRLDAGRTGIDIPIRVPAPIIIENLDEGETLRVRDVQLIDDSGAFSMSGWAGEETMLAPRETIELEVEFSPSSPGTHEAAIELYLGADPVRVAVTELRGEATPFRVRGGGCQAAGGQGAGGALWLLLAAALALFGRRSLGRIQTGADARGRGAA